MRQGEARQPVRMTVVWGGRAVIQARAQTQRDPWVHRDAHRTRVIDEELSPIPSARGSPVISRALSP